MKGLRRSKRKGLPLPHTKFRSSIPPVSLHSSCTRSSFGLDSIELVVKPLHTDRRITVRSLVQRPLSCFLPNASRPGVDGVPGVLFQRLEEGSANILETEDAQTPNDTRDAEVVVVEVGQP